MFSNISFHHSHQTLRQCISRWAQNSLLSWSFHCALIDHMDHSSWNQGNKSLAGAGTYIRLHAIGHPKTWQGGWNTPALKFSRSRPPESKQPFFGGGEFSSLDETSKKLAPWNHDIKQHICGRDSMVWLKGLVETYNLKQSDHVSQTNNHSGGSLPFPRNLPWSSNLPLWQPWPPIRFRILETSESTRNMFECPHDGPLYL